MTSESM